jgi:Ser/Thr protein kinase RdoA (MazF antagonist)
MIPVPDLILKDLCSSFNTSLDKISFLGGGMDASDGIVYTHYRGGQDYVLKILSFPLKDSTAMERLNHQLEFASFLGKNGVNIAYPVTSENGTLFETCSNEKNTFLAYEMLKLKGEEPDPRVWDEEFFKEWGRLTGYSHAVTKNYPVWQEAIVSSGKAVLTWPEEWENLSNRCRNNEIQTLWNEIRLSLEKLPVNRDCFGMIHNDNHTGNLIVSGKNITKIDIEGINCFWFTSEFAVAMQEMMYEDTGGICSRLTKPDKIRRFFDLFLEGYEKANHITSKMLSYVNFFIQYRRIFLYILFQNYYAERPDENQRALDVIRSNEQIIKF